MSQLNGKTAVSDAEIVGELPQLKPLDLGLSVFKELKWKLFSVALLPMAIELILKLIIPNTINSQGKIFLALVGVSLAKAWMFTAICMFVYTAFVGKETKTGVILKRAFRYLPKVFISLSVVAVFVTLFSLSCLGIVVTISTTTNMTAVISGLFFLVISSFFLATSMWSPVFCVGETYCDDEYEEDDEEYYENMQQTGMKAFTGKSGFDLGFMRSSWFTSNNWSLSLHVLLLLWISLMLPTVLAFSVFGFNTAFIPLVEVPLATVFYVFIVAVITISFLVSMPPYALKELTNNPDLSLLDRATQRKSIRLQGNKFLLLAMVIVACFSSLLWFAHAKSQKVPGDAVLFEISRTEVKGDTIYTKLRIEDTASRFRWFDSGEFVLYDSATRQGSEQQTSEDIENNTAAQSGSYIKASSVKLTTQDGGDLNVSQLTTLDVAGIEATLEFTFPQGYKFSNEYSLYFVTPFGAGEVIGIVRVYNN